jgi:hypothetical protein
VPPPDAVPVRPDAQQMHVAVAVRFRKVMIKPIKRYGAYRGAGTLRLDRSGIGVTGKHVRSVAIRWAIGLGLFAVCLVLTAGRLAPGFIPLYFLLEYGLLEDGNRHIPWTNVTRFASQPSKLRVAIETSSAEKNENPLVFSCDQSQEVLQALRTFAPGREVA